MSGLEPLVALPIAEKTVTVLMPFLMKRTRVARLKKGLLLTQDAIRTQLQHQEVLDPFVYATLENRFKKVMQMYDRLTTKKHGFSLKYMYCEVVDAHEFAKECLLYKMQVERSSQEASLLGGGSPSDPPAGKPGRVQQTPGDGTPPSLHIKLGDNELRIVHPEAMGLDGDDIRGLIARFGCKPVRKSKRRCGPAPGSRAPSPLQSPQTDPSLASAQNDPASDPDLDEDEEADDEIQGDPQDETQDDDDEPYSDDEVDIPILVGMDSETASLAASLVPRLMAATESLSLDDLE